MMPAIVRCGGMENPTARRLVIALKTLGARASGFLTASSGAASTRLAVGLDQRSNPSVGFQTSDTEQVACAVICSTSAMYRSNAWSSPTRGRIRNEGSPVRIRASAYKKAPQMRGFPFVVLSREEMATDRATPRPASASGEAAQKVDDQRSKDDDEQGAEHSNYQPG